MIRTVKHATVAALLALGVVAPSATAATTPAASAQAAPAPEGLVTLRPQVQSSTCLDGNANKLLWRCNGSTFQKWTLEDKNKDGVFALKYERDGQCLGADIEGEKYMRKCDGVITEDWEVTKVSGGYQIRDTFPTRCLGVDTERIYGYDVPVKLRTFECVRNKWQTWLVG
ncbi:RICIN domain-containing protein [Streptomyces sp. 058-1L]|uniref:RICIN domain-containing protein n=1 Tax=Streptomyces sp. 058-1L TaxID=2789266 RepID=UPI0039803DB3